MGVLGTDTVSFPSDFKSDPSLFTISNQTFGIIDHLSTSLLHPPVSGLLGLGFQALASSRARPVWEALIQQGSWKDPLMSFYFTRFINETGLPIPSDQVCFNPR